MKINKCIDTAKDILGLSNLNIEEVDKISTLETLKESIDQKDIGGIYSVLFILFSRLKPVSNILYHIGLILESIPESKFFYSLDKDDEDMIKNILQSTMSNEDKYSKFVGMLRNNRSKELLKEIIILRTKVDFTSNR